MNEYEKVSKEVNEWIEKNPGVTETEIVKYIYIKLGKRFSFDEKYRPAADKSLRKMIYKSCTKSNRLDESMKTNNVICSSIATIIKKIYELQNIHSELLVRKDDPNSETPHVYNLIIPKTGKPYTIDLQEDLYRIQMHGFTKNFGLSPNNDDEYIISYDEQIKIDKKIRYIEEENEYTDTRIPELKSKIKNLVDFREKVKFILESIEPIQNPNMGFADRQWYHKSVLESFYDEDIFDYEHTSGKIRFAVCYKKIKDKKVYLSTVVVITGNIKTPDVDIYVYNKTKYAYSKISLEHFANAVKKGLIIKDRDKIRPLKKVINKILKNKH